MKELSVSSQHSKRPAPIKKGLVNNFTQPVRARNPNDKRILFVIPEDFESYMPDFKSESGYLSKFPENYYQEFELFNFN